MEHQPQQPQQPHQHGQGRGRRNKYQATGRGMRDRSGAASSWLASPDTQPQHPESYTPAHGHKSPTEQSAPPGLSQQESPARQQHPSQQQHQQFPQPHQMQQAPEGHQYGLVAAVKESFAFLRAPGRQEHIFFHRSALQLDRKPDWGKESLLTLLATGSEVEFEVGPSQQDPRKVVGVWVRAVPRGTSRGLAVLQDGLSGVVVRELSGQQRRPQEGYGGKISFVRPSGAQDGASSSQQNGVSFQPDGAASPEPGEAAEPTTSAAVAGAGAGTPGEEQNAGFDGSEVHPSAGRLSVGDRVKFDLAQQTATGDLVALNVRLQRRAARPETLRLLGCVVTLKDGFGFVRPAERPGERIYFRFNDVAAGQQQLLALNAEVSFQMAPDPYDNADRASKLQVMMKQFDPSRLKMQGGSSVGRIVQAASADAAAGTQDGILSFQEGRDTLHVSFGAAQVEGDDELQQGAEVEFLWGQQPETGALKATSVKLRAQVQQEAKLELGQVSSMRQAFGFLRCVERPGELFFHFSQCATPAEELQPGDDVEFAMTREPKGHRLNAVRVRKVASGSAVFDVVSEETLEGTVKDAALPPRGYNQLPTSGVLSYQDGEGEEQLIPYGLGDLKERGLSPCLGDGVTFRISTHLATAKAAEKSDAAAAKHAGRKAVQVAPQPHHGLVAVLQESFGLVEYTPNQPYVKEAREGMQRIRFNPTDLQKGLTVRLSDEVSFVVVEDRGSKEKRARKIELIKEGDGIVPDFEDKNPNPMKFVGSQQNAGAKANFKVRIARGPDGTKGFTAELQPGNRAAMLPPPPPEPETDAAELDERAGEEDESGQAVSANGAKSDSQAGVRNQQQLQPRGQTTNKEKGKRNKRTAQDRQGPRSTAASPGLHAAPDTAATADGPSSATVEAGSAIAAETAQPVQLLRKSSSLNPLASAFIPGDTN